MASCGATPLQTAMKLASMAIKLDAGNRHKEAYCEYLRSIHYISHVLLEDTTSKSQAEMAHVEVEKMLHLAEQCLERAKSFVGKAEKGADDLSPSNETPQSGSDASTIRETTAPPEDTSEALSRHPRHRRVLSDGGGGTASPFLPPEMFQKLQEAEIQDTKKELTPIQEASRLNQKLKATYEVRLARLPPGQGTQKTSLMQRMLHRRESVLDLHLYWEKLKTFLKTLSLQRQMMENLIIAKARQDALHRKMEERRLRLQEEANRRFVASGMVTAEEQEQRLIYAGVLEYEQDHDWPKLWKATLKKNPHDGTLVSGLISHLLSCPDHPVVQLLKKLQYRIYNRLYPIVSQCPSFSPAPSPSLRASHSTQNLCSERAELPHSLPPSLSPCRDLNANTEESAHPQQLGPDRENSFEDLELFLTQLDVSPSQESKQCVESQVPDMEERALQNHLAVVVKDVHNAIDRLLSLSQLSFECLNTAAAKDQCAAGIEEAFFAPLWSPLLVLFRRVYRDRELSFEAGVRLYRHTSPDEMGVQRKLFPRVPQPGSYPYESAVQELRLLCRDTSPQRKLECIVRTLRLICACAEDYRSLQDPEAPSSTAAIGADDLLPILSFVALRTELPQLVSECAALEEFIHEGYLIGEEGYCLTSLQSALSFVESLPMRGPPRLETTFT